MENMTNRVNKITGRVTIDITDSKQDRAAALELARKLAFDKLREQMPLYKRIVIEARRELHTFAYNDKLEFMYTIKISPAADAQARIDMVEPRKTKWLHEFAAGVIAGLLTMLLIYLLFIK
jgi:hypothetical protein